jgi:hypothetical protein
VELNKIATETLTLLREAHEEDKKLHKNYYKKVGDALRPGSLTWSNV